MLEARLSRRYFRSLIKEIVSWSRGRSDVGKDGLARRTLASSTNLLDFSRVLALMEFVADSLKLKPALKAGKPIRFLVAVVKYEVDSISVASRTLIIIPGVS